MNSGGESLSMAITNAGTITDMAMITALIVDLEVSFRNAISENLKVAKLQTSLHLFPYLLPIVPVFLLKYKFPTNDYLKKCNMPVIIFHGNQDEVIYYGSSLKLKKEFKPNDTLITLSGQDHNGITENADYISALKKLIGN